MFGIATIAYALIGYEFRFTHDRKVDLIFGK
jgi:hypothetical protein